MPTVKTLLVLLATLSVTRPLLAQEGSCDVPLVVSRFEGTTGKVELVGDLGPKDLNVRLEGSRAAVKSLSADSGNKRVALILDASRNIPTNEWKLEAEMAASLIENARALDRFSFSLVETDAPAGPFVPLGDVQAKLRDIASTRPAAIDANERIYDALATAAKRLDPPEFGDTIFLFGHPEDSGSKATLEQVEETILRNRLRFYGMSFADPLRGKTQPHFDLNKPLPKNAIPGGADNISHATGYFFSYHSLDVLKMPGQLDLFETFLGTLYVGIAQPYRLNIARKISQKTAVELTIVKGQNRGIHRDDVHYPHFLYPCPSS